MQHTNICSPGNGRMPAPLLTKNPFSVHNSGVIFDFVLLISGFHRPGLSENFPQGYCLHLRFYILNHHSIYFFHCQLHNINKFGFLK